jgi:hypothetical protein
VNCELLHDLEGEASADNRVPAAAISRQASAKPTPPSEGEAEAGERGARPLLAGRDEQQQSRRLTGTFHQPHADEPAVRWP